MIYVFYAVLLVVLIYFSAFFSSSETAFISLNKIQLRRAVQEKQKNARLISKMRSRMDKLLGSILIGNNLVTTFTSSLVTTLALSTFGPKGVGVCTFVLTALIIIFGEILPKTLASQNPLRVAQNHAILLRGFDLLLTPFTVIFSLLTKFVDFAASGFGRKKKKKLITEEELKTLIDLGQIEGTLEKSEKSILTNIVEFGDLRVRDIMKPKQFVIGISKNASYDEILDTFAYSGFSKLPVYSDSLENIIGIISYKDMFDQNNFDIKKICRSACYVPETISALSVLRYMKKERHSIAIVVDEHGCNCGLITMDDILCSVFGRSMRSLNEEESSPLNRIKILKNNQVIVPGEIRLEDLNEAFFMNLSSENFDTLGGWLLEQFGSLPGVGEVIKRNGVVYEIEDQAQRRIKSVKMIFGAGTLNASSEKN